MDTLGRIAHSQTQLNAIQPRTAQQNPNIMETHITVLFLEEARTHAFATSIREDLLDANTTVVSMKLKELTSDRLNEISEPLIVIGPAHSDDPGTFLKWENTGGRFHVGAALHRYFSKRFPEAYFVFFGAENPDETYFDQFPTIIPLGSLSMIRVTEIGRAARIHVRSLLQTSVSA